MTTIIRQTLARDLDQHIEEIIKLDQQDEGVVFQEISEYVATPDIVRSYRELLDAISTGPTQPDEGVGIWVSGFFGSGKSSFAKNLGYMLANRTVNGQSAAELMAERLDDERITQLLDYISTAVPTEVIMFDVMLDRAVKRQGAEPLAEIVYTVVLRELDYAEDFDLADLEIELESEGRLDAFEQKIHELFAAAVRMEDKSPREVWRRIRKGASSINRASAALHELEPRIYGSQDSFLQKVIGRETDINIRLVVDRTYELMSRRRPGKGLVLIIDEVGQYVGRSHDKIEGLRSLVEQFGKEGRNRVLAGKAPAPVWMVVTSQEKLDEVVSNLDSKRVEIAKLQDRFRYHVDLAPADIKTVATKRVLGKNDFGRQVLAAQYEDNQGQLNTHAGLERTGLAREIGPDEFVQFYPYLPHFIDLSIDIVSGIRLQPGAPRQIGGSNRTIIKQTHEMLVSDRTRLADRPVGDLVTLDLIYELVEGNLSTEKRKDVSDIAAHFSDNPWADKVARAVALMEFVRNLPRSDRNIAALLYPRLGENSPLAEVQDALDLLKQGQYIRQTDEGYKLQTQQEKTWETERASLDPTLKELNDLTRATVTRIASARMNSFNYRNERTFRIEVKVNGTTLGQSGQIPINIVFADDHDEAVQRIDDLVVETRDTNRENDIHWVVTLSREVDDRRRDVIRSRRMIAKYEQIRSQGQANPHDLALLSEEKQRVADVESRLERDLATAISAGKIIFRGTKSDAPESGDTLDAVVRNLLTKIIPDLYPKLERGAKTVKSSDTEQILKAANLNALPAIYHEPPQGFGLVVQDSSGRWVVDNQAEIARDVMRYLEQQHAYGEKVTGRLLEQHFTAIPFGWDPEVVKLVLAALLRANAIEVTHQGRRYRSHVDPLVRAPFDKANAFRAASFAPRTRIGMQELVSAATNLEGLIGEEVDVEEEAIASRLKSLAQGELQALNPVEAQIAAHGLPISDVLGEYRDTLQEAVDAQPDDCVRLLAGQGKTLRDQRSYVQTIRESLSDGGVDTIVAARGALQQTWPLLRGRTVSDEPETAATTLMTYFAETEIYGRNAELRTLTAVIEDAYEDVFNDLHDRRRTAYQAVIEEVETRPEWEQLLPAPDATSAIIEELDTKRETVLSDLKRRVLSDESQPRPSLSQLQADINEVAAHRYLAITKLADLTRDEPDPDRPEVRLRVADLARGTISNDDELEEFIERLSEAIRSNLATGGQVIIE